MGIRLYSALGTMSYVSTKFWMTYIRTHPLKKGTIIRRGLESVKAHILLWLLGELLWLLWLTPLKIGTLIWVQPALPRNGREGVIIRKWPTYDQNMVNLTNV
jgi:hypothetical protein